jgi:hypothetical protein
MFPFCHWRCEKGLSISLILLTCPEAGALERMEILHARNCIAITTSPRIG